MNSGAMRFPDVLPVGYGQEIPVVDQCAACEGEGLDQCGQFRLVNFRRVWDICRPCNGTGRADQCRS